MKSLDRRPVVVPIDNARAMRRQRVPQLAPLQRATARVQGAQNGELTEGQSLALLGGPQRDDLAPLVNRHTGDAERGGHGTVGFEVREYCGFQHLRELTPVGNFPQLQRTCNMVVITSVNMKNNTLADRLTLAMKLARVSPTQLARDCELSSVAVHKWLSGKTVALRHETCLKAAAILRVNAEWLNTGRGDRSSETAREYHDVDVLLDLKTQLEGGLAVINSMLERQIARQQTAVTIRAPSARKKKRA
jgi:transcriptional regulator with XRE-family HTH domain